MIKSHSKLTPSQKAKLISELSELVERYNTEILKNVCITRREVLRVYNKSPHSFIDFLTGGTGNPEDYVEGYKYNVDWIHQRHLVCFYPYALKAVFIYLTGKCEKISGKYYFKDNFQNFEGLYELVWTIQDEKKRNEDLKGFGNLDIYDFCLRYAYNRARHLLPVEWVYVNHGHTHIGAKVLGILFSDFPRIEDGKIRTSDCPDWLKSYTDTKTGKKYIMYSKDIENFLCHFTPEIKQLFWKYDPHNYRKVFKNEFK